MHHIFHIKISYDINRIQSFKSFKGRVIYLSLPICSVRKYIVLVQYKIVDLSHQLKFYCRQTLRKLNIFRNLWVLPG